MQKIITPFLFILLFTFPSSAQVDSTVKQKAATSAEQKNLIKINLPALVFKNITVQYERVISKKTTIGLTVRMMPKGSIPFKSSFKDLLDSANDKEQVDNFKVGNFAIMPEIRFYLGKKGAYHGFYIAPFLSYAHYTAELPYKYDDNGTKKSIPLSGSINTITGGLMFGAQWQLGKAVYLDWWIFGPHYGSSNGSISGKQSLSPSEQASLKSDLDNFDVPLVKTTNTVNASGATIDFKGPWAGVRSGLAIGIRF